jgi:hypothetical protein
MKSAKIIALMLAFLGLGFSGCEIMPVTRYKPTLHNPFVGEMTTVAVVPFYNLTGNDKVDGREFANHFALELQRVTGFYVIANKTVEDTMWQYNIHKLESVEDIRYLAQLLKVDAIVIGKIHNFSMNYPPLAKFETEWYCQNPYLHPILEGYGLPWGTEYERYIPDKIVLLTEMNLARAQIKTQTPKFEPIKPKNTEDDSEEFDAFYKLIPPPKQARRDGAIVQMSATQAAATIPNNMQVQSTDEDSLSDKALREQSIARSRAMASTGVPYVPDAAPISDREQRDFRVQSELEHPLKQGPWQSETAKENQLPWSMQNPYATYQQNMQNPGGYVGNYPGYPQPPGLATEQLTTYGFVAQPIPPVQPMYPLMPGMPVEGEPGMVMGEPDRFPGLPEDWPDPRGLIPEGPKPERSVSKAKNEGPVISWINVYNGNDSEFMQALDDYDFLFRDDKRLSGKQTILTNRSEFIAFCCRMHIWEIFSARGGAGPAERITRTPKPWLVR